MRYYKQTADGYITAIGTAAVGGETISAEEYAAIKAAMNSRPESTGGYVYRLTTALTWELAAAEEDGLYTQEELEGKSNAELRLILTKLGLALALTKANMVRLILAAQEGGDTDGWNSIP